MALKKNWLTLRVGCNLRVTIGRRGAEEAWSFIDETVT